MTYAYDDVSRLSFTTVWADGEAAGGYLHSMTRMVLHIQIMTYTVLFLNAYTYDGLHGAVLECIYI